MEFDLEQRRFHRDASLLAESNEKWLARLAPHVTGGSDPDFGNRVEHAMAGLVAASVAPIDGAAALLDKLAATTTHVAMATNDSERSAASQVDQLGWSHLITTVVGYDSGFGPKPEPGMILALTERFAVAATETLMVGDTWADAEAAAAAGVPFCLLDPDGTVRRQLRPDYVVKSLDELEALLFDQR